MIRCDMCYEGLVWAVVSAGVLVYLDLCMDGTFSVVMRGGAG
jgi:hypothetical protein